MAEESMSQDELTGQGGTLAQEYIKNLFGIGQEMLDRVEKPADDLQRQWTRTRKDPPFWPLIIKSLCSMHDSIHDGMHHSIHDAILCSPLFIKSLSLSVSLCLSLLAAHHQVSFSLNP